MSARKCRESKTKNPWTNVNILHRQVHHSLPLSFSSNWINRKLRIPFWSETLRISFCVWRAISIVDFNLMFDAHVNIFMTQIFHVQQKEIVEKEKSTFSSAIGMRVYVSVMCACSPQRGTIDSIFVLNFLFSNMEWPFNSIFATMNDIEKKQIINRRRRKKRKRSDNSRENKNFVWT